MHAVQVKLEAALLVSAQVEPLRQKLETVQAPALQVKSLRAEIEVLKAEVVQVYQQGQQWEEAAGQAQQWQDSAARLGEEVSQLQGEAQLLHKRVAELEEALALAGMGGEPPRSRSGLETQQEDTRSAIVEEMQRLKAQIGESKSDTLAAEDNTEAQQGKIAALEAKQQEDQIELGRLRARMIELEAGQQDAEDLARSQLKVAELEKKTRQDEEEIERLTKRVETVSRLPKKAQQLEAEKMSAAQAITEKDEIGLFVRVELEEKREEVKRLQARLAEVEVQTLQGAEKVL